VSSYCCLAVIGFTSYTPQCLPCRSVLFIADPQCLNSWHETGCHQLWHRQNHNHIQHHAQPAQKYHASTVATVAKGVRPFATMFGHQGRVASASWITFESLTYLIILTRKDLLGTKENFNSWCTRTWVASFRLLDTDRFQPRCAPAWHSAATWRELATDKWFTSSRQRFPYTEEWSLTKWFVRGGASTSPVVGGYP